MSSKSNRGNNGVFAAVVDLNGCLRGKRYAETALEKLLKSEIRMPISSLGVDIWGDDVLGNLLVLQNGDQDGICKPTNGRVLPITTSDDFSGIVPMWMSLEDGNPFAADPRHALALVLDRYASIGLTPVVATELEFYLVDSKGRRAKPIPRARGAASMQGEDIYSLSELTELSPFFDDLYEMSEACGIIPDAAISEGGPGQFEINLNHVADALKAADNAFFFKEIVKICARKHAMAASFMSKPYEDQAGSGLHVHFSVLDEDGVNVFDDGTSSGSATMTNAVGGLINSMCEMTLVFAPHLNSYKRLTPGSLAPSKAAWGYENRTAAIRIPGGPNTARRIEHRVAGADTNPYLVLAAVLGAAFIGIEEKLSAPTPLSGDAHKSDGKNLPFSWNAAISEFESGAFSQRIFEPSLRSMFVSCKNQELNKFSKKISDFEYEAYLDSV